MSRASRTHPCARPWRLALRIPLTVVLIVLLPLARAGVARADTPRLPARLRIAIEPCSPAALDFETYLQLLRVELQASGVAQLDAGTDAEPGAAVDEPTAELIVSSPTCDMRVVLRLRFEGRASEDALDAGELPALGRERALALATVERLQRAWPALHARRSEPATAPEAAAPSARTPSPPAARSAAPDRRAYGQGALGLGLRFSTDAPLASLGLSLDAALSRALALGGALGWRSEQGGPATDTDAHSLSAGPRLELVLLRLDALELAAAAGLAVGVGWIVTARAGGDGARVSSSPAPLGLATSALGLRARVAFQVFLQTGVTLDYALLGARFETRGGRRLATLTGARVAAFVGVGTRFGG